MVVLETLTINIRKKLNLLEDTKMDTIKIGSKIKIICMAGEPQYSGREGIVTHIDDAGQIHGTWGGCAVIPEVDTYIILKKSTTRGNA